MVVIALVVVAIVILAVVTLVVTQPRANFVGISKRGPSGNSMFFDATIHTSGASIGVDRLHVTLRSVRAGVAFDQVVFYNLETIPAGTTFVWDVDVLIDPFDEPSFTYEFGLEVNGTPMDSSTVS